MTEAGWLAPRTRDVAAERSPPDATVNPTTDPADVPIAASAFFTSIPFSARPTRSPASHPIPTGPPPPRTNARVMRQDYSGASADYQPGRSPGLDGLAGCRFDECRKQAGPAAGGIERGANLVLHFSEAVQIAVFERNEGSVRPLGDEAHFDLGQ
jgi:hypothetical protein